MMRFSAAAWRFERVESNGAPDGVPVPVPQLTSFDRLQATIEAIEILQNHVDGSDRPGRWLEIPEVGREVRVRAWLRLKGEARQALTGPGDEQ